MSLRHAAVFVLVGAAACTTAAEPVSHRVIRDVEVAQAERPVQPTPVPTPVPIVDVPYRVEVHVDDGDGFAELLAQTMADPRGWIRAGYRLYEDPAAPHVVVLAEGAVVDELCHPYDTGGRFSCQNGPVVAINADRWRIGVPHWTLGLDDYRRMLLNHEMGHLVGQRHIPCTPGRKAPVMFQQSGSLRGCLANPWPLDTEIAVAARHDQPIAPGYGE